MPKLVSAPSALLPQQKHPSTILPTAAEFSVLFLGGGCEKKGGVEGWVSCTSVSP